MTDEKKLQDEMLSDEQLEQVVGGYSSNRELCEESIILYRFGFMDGIHDSDNAVASRKKNSRRLVKSRNYLCNKR